MADLTAGETLMPSRKPPRIFKPQAGITRKTPIRLSIAETANKIRLNALAGKERAVHSCVVEA
jgi:hypothetical protein